LEKVEKRLIQGKEIIKMKGKNKIGRREFLGKATLAGLTLPVMLQGGMKTGHAKSDQSSTTGPREIETKMKMKRICIEEHWSTKELDEIGMQWRARIGSLVSISSQTTPPSFVTRLRRLGDFEEFRLPLMDESGITMQVLALSSPGIQGITDASKAIDVAKRTNDFQAEIICKHPDRFAGFAALPTQDPKAAANELWRTIKKLGFKGAMIQGHTNWEYLDAQKYWVIWERAEALGVPIYLHVSEPSRDSMKMYDGYPELTGPTWGWGVETATHALRIIASGVFDAFPKAMLILGHLGESLPYLLGRLDEGYGYTAFGPKKLKKSLSEYIKENVLITTSGLYHPEALVCAISAMGAERILFAVDYPFIDPKVSVGLFETTAMNASDREKIYHLNAERLLRL
jgi:2,3-dihydroxybenzoate decarboxylase